MNNQWRNRIIKTEQADPLTLLENPDNWRIHPQFQKDALKEVLETIGWVDDVIVNINTNRLVDGHLRVWLAREHAESTIPVTYVDLTDDEEALILSIIDPIAELAQTDEDAITELRTHLAQARSLVGQMLDDIAQSRASLNVQVKMQKERTQGNTALRIGTHTIKIPREVYMRWREDMFQTISFDRKEIIAEMRQRLGL